MSKKRKDVVGFVDKYAPVCLNQDTLFQRASVKSLSTMGNVRNVYHTEIPFAKLITAGGKLGRDHPVGTLPLPVKRIIDI